jgi:hypothetical protein
MPATNALLTAAAAMFLALSWFASNGAAQGATGPNVIIRLRLSGDTEPLPAIRSCLADRLSQMPDVKVATTPIEGARFIIDLVAAKSANETASASVVVAETFPMEQFLPRIKEGENRDALLNSIRYYTLLRLHQLLPAQTYEKLCSGIAADIAEKVLAKEYTERND